MGLVRTFQLVQLFKGMTVAENVEVGFHLATKGGVACGPHAARLVAPPGNRRARAKRANCSLSSASPPRPGTNAELLPYGQQRLLEVARALAAKPRLLLLDEPAAGLNAHETDALAAVIQQHQRARESPCCSSSTTWRW